MPHAAGKLMRIIVLVAGEAEAGQPELCGFVALRGGLAQHFEPKLDIGDGAAPRQQAVILEDNRDAPAKAVEFAEWIAALHKHAPGTGFSKAGDHVEER